MKEWLELNIAINGFQYAVREEVNNLKNIEKQGIQLSSRLHELINKRENKNPVSNKCKVKPGTEYIFSNNKGLWLSSRHPESRKDVIYEYEDYNENYLKLKNPNHSTILVRKENIIPL